jgi:hypothetical protein
LLACLSLVTGAAPVETASADRLAEAIQGLGLVLVGPGIVLSFVALEVVLWLLAPTPLEAICRTVARGRGRCLLVGMATLAVAFLLLGLLSKRGPLADLTGALVVGLLALGLLTGMTAVAGLLGQTVVQKATGQSGNPVATVAIGAAVLAAAGVFPVVGWVLFAYFLLVGLGGFLLSLMGGRDKE